MADSISGIVDPSSYSELQKLIDLLGKTEQAIADCANEAKNIKINFQGADTLASISAQIDKMSSSIHSLNQVQQQNAATVAQQAQVTAVYGDGAADVALKLANLKTALFDATQGIKEITNQLNQGKISQENYDAELSKLTLDINTFKLAIKTTNGDLNNLIISQNQSAIATVAESDSIVGLTARLKELTTQYKLLTAEERKSAEGNALANSIKETSNAMVMASRSIQDTTNKLGIMDRIGQQASRTFIRFIAMQPELLAFAVLAKVFDSAAESIMKCYNETKVLNEAMQKHTATARENIASEQANAEALLNTAKNTNLSLSVRKNAIDELRKATGTLLQDYKDEIFLAGQTAEAHDKIAESILHEQMAKQYGGRALEARKGLSDLTGQQVNEAGDIIPSKLDNAKAAYKSAQAQADEAQSHVLMANNTYDVLREKLQLTKNEYENLQKTVDKYQKMVSNYDKLQQEELEKYDALFPKKEKKKTGTVGLSPLAPNETGEKKFYQAVRDAMKFMYQNEAETQRAISEDTSKSLKERLDANIKYQHALNQLTHSEADRRIEIEATVIKNAQNKISGYQKQMGEIEHGLGGKTKQFYKDDNVKLLQDKITEQQKIIEDARIRAVITNRAKSDKEYEDNAQKADDNMINIFKSNGAKRIKIEKDANEKLILADNEYVNNEITNYLQALSNKEISRQQFNNKIEGLMKMEHEKELQAAIDGDNKLLSNEQLTADQIFEIRKDLATKTKQLNDSKANIPAGSDKAEGSALGKLFNNLIGDSSLTGKDGKDQMKAAEDVASKTIELAQHTADAVKTIKDNEFAHEQDLLNLRLHSIEIQAGQEIQSINASVGYEIQKKNQLSVVNAQTQAQENAIRQQEKDLAIKKARFDRSAAEANIIMGVAAAEAQALTYLTNPITAPFYPYIAGLIASIGAVEIAAASSAPIPSYRYGTDATVTPQFEAGEAGENEWIKAPNKPGYWSGTSAKIFTEPLGTSVTPISKMRKFAEDNLTNSLGIDANSISVVLNESKDEKAYQILASTFEAKISEIGDDIVHAIHNSKTEIPDMTDAIRMMTVQNKLRGL